MVRIILLRFLESYFRRPLLSLLPLVVALAAGGAFVYTAPPEYVATGRLFVEKESLLASLTSTTNDGSWWITPAQATTGELSELIASRAFTRSVIQKTSLESNMSGGDDAINETFTYYREALSFQPRGDKLVEISAASDNPQLAHEMVVATMDAYVQWKLNADYRESVAAQSFFENLIGPYTEEVEQARAELVAYFRAFPAPVRGERPPEEQLEVDRLTAALNRAEERLSNAQDNEEDARFSQSTSETVTRQTYLVIDQPNVPQAPEVSITGIVQDMAIFVVAGIIFSLAVVGLGALLDTSLRFPFDVRNALSLPVLAMVPRDRQVASASPAPAAQSEGAVPSDPTVLQPQL